MQLSWQAGSGKFAMRSSKAVNPLFYIFPLHVQVAHLRIRIPDSMVLMELIS